MFHVEQNSIKTYTNVTLESYTCNTFPAAFRDRQRLRIISDSIPADTCRLDSGHNRRPDNSQQKLILVPTVTTELPLFVVSSIIENPTLVSPSAAVENIVAVSNRPVVPTVVEGPAYRISRFLHSVLRTLVGTTVQRNRQPALLQNAGASECADCKTKPTRRSGKTGWMQGTRRRGRRSILGVCEHCRIECNAADSPFSRSGLAAEVDKKH